MSPLRFIIASLRHYRRVHVAVALGVAVATAVLTGALLVGDSVSGSMRDLTLQRLGKIESALVAGHTFRAALADELAADAAFKQHFATAEPAILMTGTLQSGSGDDVRRATQVSVVGCRPAFWSFGEADPPSDLEGDQVALTESLARELGVKSGDDVLLRLPITAAIPADSPLGEKSETSSARRLKVATVLPTEGISRFSLMPSQHLPRNAFVSIVTLQGILSQPAKANAIFVASDEKNHASDNAARMALTKALKPRLEDYGVRVEHIAEPRNLFQIAAEQLVLPEAIVSAAQRASNDRMQPIVTYLANSIAKDEGEEQRKIPYSTITGVDSTFRLGPLNDGEWQPILLADDEIALNRWAADDLQAEIGDTITVSFYEPESTHGQLREHKPVKFKLRAIVELEDVDGNPSAAADPKLTPELSGVTDRESINDWELPFDLVEKIRQEDEDYWDKYRTTPKAFVSLATAKRFWSSRWGTISLLRWQMQPSDQTRYDEINRHFAGRRDANSKGT